MRFQYALIEIDRDGGAATGWTVANSRDPMATTRMGSIFPVESEFCNLVEGGYVVDLRPLNNTPGANNSVSFAPSGMLDYAEDIYLTGDAFNYANQLRAVLNGNMPYTDLPATPVIIDDQYLWGGYSSAMFYALAWASRGAHVGSRQGNNIIWLDSASTPITNA